MHATAFRPEVRRWINGQRHDLALLKPLAGSWGRVFVEPSHRRPSRTMGAGQPCLRVVITMMDRLVMFFDEVDEHGWSPWGDASIAR